MQPPPQIRDLLEERAHVRRLAALLANDPSEAEDLEQRTWLGVLLRPPRHTEGLRSWLSIKVRYLAINSAESRRRREDRERQAHRPEETSTPLETLEQMSVVQSVESALTSLGPRYSKILRMRYYDDLPPREIAAQLDMSVETVYTRLKRGLSSMRERLDNDFGDRRTWSVMLLALLPHWPRKARPVAIGVSTGIGATVLKLMAASILVLGLGYTLVSGGREVDLLARPVPGTEGDATGIAPDLLRPTSTELEISTLPREVATRSEGSLSIRAIDVRDGSGVSGLSVRLRSVEGANEKELRTGRDGNVSALELAPGVWEVLPERGRAKYTSVHAARETNLTLEVPAGKTVEVLTTAMGGSALAGARVSVSAPGTLSHWRAKGMTDDAGRATLRDVDPEYWVMEGVENYRPTLAMLVSDPAAGDRITFEMSASVPFRGRIIDPAGAGVPGARLEILPNFVYPFLFRSGGVVLANWRRPTAIADEEGNFRMDGLLGRRSELGVSAPGFESQVVGLHLRAEQYARRVITLQRSSGDREPHAFTGRILDRDGAPAEGCLVLAQPSAIEERSPLAGLVRGPETRVFVTDPLGRFQFLDAAQPVHDVWVFAPGAWNDQPVVHVPGMPAGVEAQLNLAGPGRGEIRGRLASNVPEEACLLLHSPVLPRSHSVEFTPGTREFAVAGLPEGDYSLSLWVGGMLHTVVARRSLAARVALSVGELSIPATGTIRLQLSRDNDGGFVGAWARLNLSDENFQRVVSGTQLEAGAFEADGRVTFWNVPTGTRSVVIGGPDLQWETIPVLVHEGESEVIQAELRSGNQQPFRLMVPDGELRTFVIEIRDPLDRTVHHHSVETRSGDTQRILQLPEGSFRALYREEGGPLYGHAFEVQSGMNPVLELNFTENELQAAPHH